MAGGGKKRRDRTSSGHPTTTADRGHQVYGRTVANGHSHHRNGQATNVYKAMNTRNHNIKGRSHSSSSSSSSRDGESCRLFPRWTPVVVWILCTAARVVHVRQPGNWWILHPDENFQSLEVAHTQVYGYGFRPYEFSSVSQDGAHGSRDTNTSYYRQRELQLGMHGMRSALYPFFFVTVSYVADVIGLDVTPFALWKMAHAVVSSLLPLSAYQFTTVYFRCHDAACLAAILVAMSTHLTVLGTHTLVNSFLSPGVFWSLSCILPLVHGSSKASESKKSSHETHGCLSNGISGRSIGINGRPNGMNGGSNGINGGTVHNYAGHSSLTMNQIFSNGSAKNGSLNYSPVSRLQNGAAVNSNSSTENTPESSQGCNGHTTSNGSSGYQRTNYVSNGSTGYHLFDKQENFTHKVQKSAITFTSGLVLALCIYIRLDCLLLTAVTLLPRFSPWRARYCSLLLCACGFCFGIACGLLEDFFFYNAFVLSPGNWARFNIIRDLAGHFFGKSSVSKYFVALFANNAGLPGLCFLNIVVLLIFIPSRLKALFAFDRSPSSHKESKSTTNSGNTEVKEVHNIKANGVHSGIQSRKEKTTNLRDSEEFAVAADNSSIFDISADVAPVVSLTLSWTVLFIFYACKDHKELRFLHNTIVLFLFSSAYAIALALKTVGRACSLPSTRALLVAVLALLAADQWRAFPASEGRSRKPWAYQGLWESSDVNACLAYVGGQRDVGGVFIDSNFHATGAYSLLHHDVPLITLLVEEFVEFDLSAKVKVSGQRSVLDRSRSVSYVTIDRLSNFVSVQNAAYVVKLIIQDKRYNYFVVARDRKFLAVGFKEVFTYGTMRVLKRTFDAKEEQQLKTMAAKVPVGVNATVLKYEGDVLYRFHRFQLAMERYMASYHISNDRAPIYQTIAACNLKLGDQSEARRWIDACAARFGVVECKKPLTIVNINSERALF